MIRLLHGDCLDLMRDMPDNSVDAVVCDPPYELGFMGKSWDSSGVAFDPETWAAAWRVLKPGGHLIAFGGTRTVHRIAVAIEDAGFEIRDTLHWCYWCLDAETEILTVYEPASSFVGVNAMAPVIGLMSKSVVLSE